MQEELERKQNGLFVVFQSKCIVYDLYIQVLQEEGN